METAKEKGEIILVRRNFFERMEREINLRNEYVKIENMCWLMKEEAIQVLRMK